jgi:tetratricopeptide (TPR) repeat protein
MSRRKVSESLKTCASHTAAYDRTGAHAERTTRCGRMLILLIACLGAHLGTESLVRSQGQPRPSRPDRIPTADTEMTAPRHASPNADYALSSLASRTVAPSDGNDTSMEINDILARRLWQNRISAPDPDEDAEIRSALRSLIQQVQSMTFEDSATTPTFSAPLESPVEPQRPTVGTAPSVGTEPSQPLPAPTSATEPPASLPADTLKQLEGLMQNPDQISNPLEMAELLFLSGRVAEAALFYEKALAQMPASDLTNSEDRAWVLFQLGNCLRETDMGKARETYMKLIAQHPNSPWTELAKAHGRLITWYQSARPNQLIAPSE